jgi:Na+-driven multidrug efflux pump
MQTCTAFYGSIGLINALVLLIVYYFSGTIFNVTPEQDAILKQLLIVLACMALVNWYTATYTQLISATENVAWIQKRTLLTKLLMVVVLLATVFFKLSVVEFVIGTNLVTLIILPLTIRKIRIETPFVKFHAKFDKQTFKEILPYSFNIFSFGIFQFTFQKLRVVL